MKILIADDHELFLKGLEFILQDLEDSVQLKLAHSYTEIFQIIQNETDFDLVVTDLAMPGANWLDALNKIHITLPETPIVILSAVFDPEIVHKTIDLGAAAYLPKTSSNAIILNAMRLVLSGGVYIPPELLNVSACIEENILSQLKSKDSERETLTPRQLDVLQLIAKGCSNKIIAHELGLTEGTVKLHVTALLKALNVYNRTGAVIEATKRGLIKQ